MTESYSNLQGCKIIQNANLFTIEFTYPSPVVCHSLVKTRILRGATISDDYKQVIFKAYSVQVYCQEMQAHKSNMVTIAISSVSTTGFSVTAYYKDGRDDQSGGGVFNGTFYWIAIAIPV